MTTEFYIRNVADVVHSWMNYLYEVSDTKHLAAESSLRYPISGLLERKKDIDLEMEVDHPNFTDARIDFMWSQQCGGAYLELKYIRDGSVDVQSIYDDIFRLALIKKKKYSSYLLICGESNNFDKYFKNRKVHVERPFKEGETIKIRQTGGNMEYVFQSIFAFDMADNNLDHEIATQNFDGEKEGDYYCDFKSRYDKKLKNNNTNPTNITIRTTLIQEINKGFKSSVALWKIERV